MELPRYLREATDKGLISISEIIKPECYHFTAKSCIDFIATRKKYSMQLEVGTIILDNFVMKCTCESHLPYRLAAFKTLENRLKYFNLIEAYDTTNANSTDNN